MGGIRKQATVFGVWEKVTAISVWEKRTSDKKRWFQWGDIREWATVFGVWEKVTAVSAWEKRTSDKKRWFQRGKIRESATVFGVWEKWFSLATELGPWEKRTSDKTNDIKKIDYGWRPGKGFVFGKKRLQVTKIYQTIWYWQKYDIKQYVYCERYRKRDNDQYYKPFKKQES